MGVGDRQPQHGDHIGHKEEDDLKAMVQQRHSWITIRPDHDAVVSRVLGPDGCEEEGGKGHDDTDQPYRGEDDTY